MVDFDCETSNTIFEIFGNWEAYLKAENIDIPKLLQEADLKEIELSHDPLSGNSAATATTKKALADDQKATGKLTKAFPPERGIKPNASSSPRRSSPRLRGPSR